MLACGVLRLVFLGGARPPTRDLRAPPTRYKRLLLELDETPRIGRTEIRRLELEIRQRLAAWQAMLRRRVPEARDILRKLVVGRIVLTPRPEARIYEFSGPGRSGG